jgi:hypothetical protein
MSRKNQRAEEDKIVAYISSIFPTFLDGISFVPAGTDPPDFLEKYGGKIGLELTSWLNRDQVSAARGRECMREDLLRIVEWEKHPRPRNFSFLVIMPRWGKRIREGHYQPLCSEFHASTQDIDNNWKTLRESYLRPEVLGRELSREERFDYLMERSEIKRYPTLDQYIKSIWFTEPRKSTPAFPEEPWISIEQDGGIYDPAWAIQALRSAVESKVDRYNKKAVKACLGAQNLRKLYLLVYTDPARFSYNTPYQTCSQLMTSPVEGLAEAAKTATEGVSMLPGVFDGIFLLYHVWNARWFAQIWPTVQYIPAIDL